MQTLPAVDGATRPGLREPPKLAVLRACAMIIGFVALLLKKPYQHSGFWYWLGLSSFLVALAFYAVPVTRLLRRQPR